MVSRPDLARQLFAPIAADYERWARLLSLGQDARWRRKLLSMLDPEPGWLVLDLAAGTGQIGRSLSDAGCRVVSADITADMLAVGVFPGSVALAAAEHLPFTDGAFDGVAFGYLLRYVDDVAGCMAEIARVVRPGGAIAMLEFARPSRAAGLAWTAYTRLVLPAVGCIIGSGWRRVGRFLGPSIDEFSRRMPLLSLVDTWDHAGLVDIETRSMSLGGGLVMTARKP